MNTILYVDGGCEGNGQLDLNKRKMVAVVTDNRGVVLIDKHQEGGSNNIAELLAVKEALIWCSAHQISEVEIRTDSRNNLSWVLGKKVGKKVNDRVAVLNLKNAINAIKGTMKKFKIIWVPRENNLAGHYIEETYTL